MSTAHDREILNHVFNPLLPLGNELVEEEILEKAAMTPIIDNGEEVALSRQLELEGLKKAEEGQLDEALTLFSTSIHVMPLRPSPFNNRAQAYRLKGEIEKAEADLETALVLSGGKGGPGCQALCQRALIAMKQNRNEDAKVDLEKAAKLGSNFAKAQLAQMNPYAALCNRMLRDVMGKMTRGESDYYEGSNNKTSAYKL